MKLKDYLAGINSAKTPNELEEALQAPFNNPFRGPTWARISNAREAVGKRLCDESKFGNFVPRFGRFRQLTVCGQTYRVASGGNSTGVRYAWHYANEWASGVMRENGLPDEVIKKVLDRWAQYPHRALKAVEDHFTKSKAPNHE